MNKLIKFSAVFCAMLCLLGGFSSCEEDTHDADSRYTFGLTSAINGNNAEIEAIETAYCDAYKNAGLNYGNFFFAPGTSEEAILKACAEAEHAILTAALKFDGKYTYAVRSAEQTIYQKSYGTR